MRYSSKVKAVAWLLRLNGVILMFAIAAVFLSTETMQSIHAFMGMGDLPRDPIVEYLTRSISALYAIHGGLTLVISLNIQRCWPVVPWIAGLHMLFGGLLVIIDLLAKMPTYWTIIEGPPIIVFAAVVFLLWWRATEEQPVEFDENN